MHKFKILYVVFIVLFFNACSQKVLIKAIAPAEVGAMATKKKVAISEFKRDRVGLSGKIESKIASHKLDRKKYFTVVSRRDIDKVLNEQKLQSSELMDEETTTRVGKIIGAQAIVNGEITTASGKDGMYLDKRKRCEKYDDAKKCIKYKTHYVKCTTSEASLIGNINIVNIETASIIYGESFNKNYKGNTCKNSRNFLKKKQALEKLSTSIANEFVYKLVPSYVYFRVTLLDEIEFDVSNKQEQKLKNALEYINSGRMDKAEKILTMLLDEFDGNSYVLAYDLGVVKESLGKYDEAKNLYSLADEISSKPVQELNIALNRIDDVIVKRDEANGQINAQ